MSNIEKFVGPRTDFSTPSILKVHKHRGPHRDKEVTREGHVFGFFVGPGLVELGKKRFGEGGVQLNGPDEFVRWRHGRCHPSTTITTDRSGIFDAWYDRYTIREDTLQSVVTFQWFLLVLSKWMIVVVLVQS